MTSKKSALGFGFQPDQSQHHFLVTIPRSADGTVLFYERFKWQEGVEQQQLDDLFDKAKAMISKHKWKLIEEAVRTEFNRRLKKEGIVAGKWKTGQVPVERLLGKELLILVWSIEDSDPSVIPIAIRNWLGLSPEERWWLYTMTNASTGKLHDKRGWRKAIRYALTENPVEENRKQMDLFEFLFEQQKDE